VRLVDKDSGKEFCRYSLSSLGNKNGLIVCKLVRLAKKEGHTWALQAIGITVLLVFQLLGKLSKGRTALELVTKVKKHYAPNEGAKKFTKRELRVLKAKNLEPKDSNGLSG
jgi:hypothetical protein